MKCNKIQKWIHLNKEGELSEKEKTLLDEHLSTCDACNDLLISVESADKLIQNIKRVEPELTYPQVLSSNIMQSISNEKVASKNIFIPFRIFELLFTNKVRVLAYTIIIGLIGLFSYQQLFILSKLNRMEQKIAVKSSEDAEINYLPTVNTKLFKVLSTGLEDEQIVIDRRTLEQFLESYKELKTDHEELLDLFNKNAENFERKLSKKDIIKLKQLLNEDDLVKNLSTNL